VAGYLAPGQLHTAFNFEYLGCAWDPAALRSVIERTAATHVAVDAPATWVLSNHDSTRHVTRYGRRDTSFAFDTRHVDPDVDMRLGTRRARAAALLTLALPGAAYIYQGEELGLWEVEDIPPAKRQDPMYWRSGGTNPGRDGCRVPLPWSGAAPPFGFSPPGSDAAPWLPQPAAWRDHTVEKQAGDAGSMLTLYRAALRLRHQTPSLRERQPMSWLSGDDGVLAFRRGTDFVCMVNLSRRPAELPPEFDTILTSGPGLAGRLPPDTAAWLRPA
jgi:alpha-glucosidase